MKKVSSVEERLSALLDGIAQSDAAIADAVGVSRQALSSWRTGVRSPKMSAIVLLANYFCVDPIWLMGYDVPQQDPPDVAPLYSADEAELVALWRGAELSAREIAREVLANHQKKTEERQA